MFPPFGLLNCGITPARAGKTAFAADYLGNPRDHPRSCGKDIFDEFDKVIVSGSPPLVRERRRDYQFKRLYAGITPARAGKTFVYAIGNAVYEDHPRSCGKDPCKPVCRDTGLGSPPLVRERRVQVGKAADDVGITPARAGKT